MAARKGVVTFGLVSIPVELTVAARSQTLDFDLLHRPCGTRVRYRLYCPTHEREVGRDEVVKGYKLGGKYVALADEDLEAAERASTRAIEVVRFVKQHDVDPVYLERSYWVGPQKDAERACQVLLEAMRRSGRAAVVTFVMASRQQYALLRPAGDRLALHTLYYGDEVRALEAEWRRPKPRAEEIALAERLIESLAGPFEPERYRDEHRETLLAVIRAKAKGEAVELPEAPKPRGAVVDLMSALRESVARVRAGGGPPRRSRGAARRRPGARRAGSRKSTSGRAA
jgi:DNA end-binding protein Ku